MSSTIGAAPSRDALLGRLFDSFLGGMEMLSVYVGDRLGLYAALATGGAKTSSELADAAGVHGRYAREWLEQQGMSGILAVDDEAAGDTERRYSLPSAYHELLLDERNLNFMAPLAQALVACVRPIDALMDAFRSGGGVPYADYGAD